VVEGFEGCWRGFMKMKWLFLFSKNVFPKMENAFLFSINGFPETINGFPETKNGFPNSNCLFLFSKYGTMGVNYPFILHENAFI
jgi:hypothetical protein